MPAFTIATVQPSARYVTLVLAQNVSLLHSCHPPLSLYIPPVVSPLKISKHSHTYITILMRLILIYHYVSTYYPILMRIILILIYPPPTGPFWVLCCVVPNNNPLFFLKKLTPSHHNNISSLAAIPALPPQVI